MKIEEIKVGSEYYHYRKDPDDKDGPPIEVGRSKVLDIEAGRGRVLLETSMVHHVMFGPRYSYAHSVVPASWIISLAPTEPIILKIGDGPSVDEMKDQIRSLEQEVRYYKSKPWFQFWK